MRLLPELWEALAVGNSLVGVLAETPLPLCDASSGRVAASGTPCELPQSLCAHQDPVMRLLSVLFHTTPRTVHDAVWSSDSPSTRRLSVPRAGGWNPLACIASARRQPLA
jgi:hypothetical protein